ncbi:flagellar protein FlgN [Janibacter cremeus]|uniref:Putative nuclease with TOPRIM domain n=1 Tax=Janibacter cremeus TaxID=1285192 RepID=A0A852VP29_9MICO|nr:flagellar protein FlgN [Janibacter cremeus]NYF98787.1 putative nuclease with TOPRIM domain [Janibacter cremeus]
MPDVYIDIGELEKVHSQLGEIVTEFENATSNSETLEADIGDPFGRGRLREKAQEFEERWDDKRDELKEGLDKIRTHVGDVLENFKSLDTEIATDIEASKAQTPAQPSSGPSPTRV